MTLFSTLSDYDISALLMKSKHSPCNMAGAKAPIFQFATPLIFTLLLILGSWSITLNVENELPIQVNDENQYNAGAKFSGGDIDVPLLYVGDTWTYSGFFDVVEMIESAGVDTDAEALVGDLEMWVDDVKSMSWANFSSVSYIIKSRGVFIGENVTLDGTLGTVNVKYESTETVRAGDLAIIKNEVFMDVNFTISGAFPITLAVVTAIDSYYEPREDYDFPLRVGEEWSNEYLDVNTWQGNSYYFTIPDDETLSYKTSHAVVSVGDPVVEYSGCGDSYNVTAFDENGTIESFRWWCPAAKNDAWRHFENALGMYVDFYLKDFQPATPDKYIDVDFEYSTWALNTPLDVWVNITDASSGAPVPNHAFVLRYEHNNNQWITLTTASNGTAYYELDTSDPLDTTPSNHDYASHGIVAWDGAGKNHGVDTLSLDEELVELDYRPRPGGISLVRVRDNDTMTLNPLYGFNAIAGDVLHFTVPIDNKGMSGGPATELEMHAPDDTFQRLNINALPPVGEQTLQFSWTVPPTQQLGLTNFTFEVDPDDLMPQDVNQSNDLSSFPIFIGVIPVVNLTAIESSYTLIDLLLDATGSNDGDGGSLHCTFEIETSENIFEIFEEDDCQKVFNWPDDGTFSVYLTITDEENDRDQTSMIVEILNRAPWVNITSPSETLPAESNITFNAFDSGDADTLYSEAPVDALWILPIRSDGFQYQCEDEGTTITMTCTVTPMEEGAFVMVLEVTDDDGEITSTQYSLQVTNINPRDVVMTMSDGTTSNGDPAPSIWNVVEDQEVSLKGEAVDTMNDQDSLIWNWASIDSDDNFVWQESTNGADSEIQVSWSKSGTHHVELDVLDDDGASAGVLAGFVTVTNVPPTSEPFSAQLPVGEDRPFKLTGFYSDTQSDVDSLQVCWDVDLANDADDNLVNFDDCDYVGDSINHSWPVAGEYTVRFHVTDDDGAVAESIVNVSVVNLRPKAVASAEKTSVSVGEEVVISSSGTSDTESDISLLIFTWDLDITTDSNGDGDPANDPDSLTSRTGSLHHTFETSGTKHIRLMVSDGDLVDTADITIEVTGGSGGFLGVMGETAGVSNLIIALLVVIGALLTVGITVVKKKDSDEMTSIPNSEELEEE